MKKWLPEVVGGAIVYKLVDLITGETLDISKTKPGRRMNVLNPRALARANRRMEGFRSVAVRSLKQYGYHVSAHRHPKKK